MNLGEARKLANEKLTLASLRDDSDEATVGEAYDALEDYIRHVPDLANIVLALADEVERSRKALRFYAKTTNYSRLVKGGKTPIQNDRGCRAGQVFKRGEG